MLRMLAVAFFVVPLMLSSQRLNMSRDLVAKGIAPANMTRPISHPWTLARSSKPLPPTPARYGIQTVIADPGA
jgi:hypothetical protein